MISKCSENLYPLISPVGMKRAVILTYEGNPFVISIFRFYNSTGFDGTVEVSLAIAAASGVSDALLVASPTLNYVEYSG